MNKELYTIIQNLESKNLSDIKILALVSDTYYEVEFYARYEGELLQSNDLGEREILNMLFIDEIYKSIATIIREDKKYDLAKLNVVKASEESIKIEYFDKTAKIYPIKKEWRNTVLNSNS